MSLNNASMNSARNATTSAGGRAASRAQGSSGGSPAPSRSQVPTGVTAQAETQTSVEPRGSGGNQGASPPGTQISNGSQESQGRSQGLPNGPQATGAHGTRPEPAGPQGLEGPRGTPNPMGAQVLAGPPLPPPLTASDVPGILQFLQALQNPAHLPNASTDFPGTQPPPHSVPNPAPMNPVRADPIASIVAFLPQLPRLPTGHAWELTARMAGQKRPATCDLPTLQYNKMYCDGLIAMTNKVLEDKIKMIETMFRQDLQEWETLYSHINDPEIKRQLMLIPDVPAAHEPEGEPQEER